jgi:hypothetical protein
VKIGLTTTETLVIERVRRGELTIRVESTDSQYRYRYPDGIGIPTEYLGVVIETLKLHKVEANKAARE